MSTFKWIPFATVLGSLSLAWTATSFAQNANQLQPNQNQTGQNQVGTPVPGNADASNRARNQNTTAGFNTINQQPWFSNTAVRDQLQLNDAQFSQLNRGYNQAWSQYYKSWAQIMSNQELTPQQRDQQLQKLDSGFYRDFSNTVDSTFTNPGARQRFNELGLQYRGYSAFSDPILQQQLELTPEQQQRFSQYQNDWNQRWNRWNTTYSQNPAQVTTQYNEWRNGYRNSLNQTLTPQQQQIWNSLTGKVYDFPADVYFQNTTTTTAKPVIP